MKLLRTSFIVKHFERLSSQSKTVKQKSIIDFLCESTNFSVSEAYRFVGTQEEFGWDRFRQFFFYLFYSHRFHPTFASRCS